MGSMICDIREQFGTAYEQGGYRRTLKRLSRLGVRRDQAEDLVQSAWLRGFERLDQLREQTNLLSWIDAIAINLVRTAARHSQPVDQIPEAAPAGRMDINPVSIEVRQALQRCSPRQRRVLQLIYLEGYTRAEAAQTLGVTMQAFYGQLARARRALRDHMSGLTTRRRPEAGLAAPDAPSDWEDHRIRNEVTLSYTEGHVANRRNK